MCAVSPLIPDDKYVPLMEGTVSSLIYAVLAGKWDLDKTVFNEDIEDLLGDLQEVHDIKANEGGQNY